MEREVLENILSQLDESDWLFSPIKFYKKEDKLQLIGKGGFATVYDMVDCNNSEIHYALKVLQVNNKGITLKKCQEAFELQKTLSDSSDYIVKSLDSKTLKISFDEEMNIQEVKEVHGDIQEEKGCILHFILMEKLEDLITRNKFGQVSLNKEISSEEEVLKFAMQIGKAIQTAHKRKILHRDVKLENIFFDEKTSCYKLGDFGNAKLVEDESVHTIIYTDGYGSPEIKKQFENSYDNTTDIYSFGICLYLLLNHLKFPGSDGYHVKSIQYTPSFVFPAPENASRSMAYVIRRMCSYNREERYQYMEEVLDSFRNVRQSRIESNRPSEDLSTQTYFEEHPSIFEQNEEEDFFDNDSETEKKLDYKRDYERACIPYIIGFSVLFTCLLVAFQEKMSFMADWRFLAFLFAILVECVLITVGEIHGIGEIVVLLIGWYLIELFGINAIYITLIFCVLTRIPRIMFSGIVGVGLWAAFEFAGKFKWLAFIQKYNLGWIIILFLIILYWKHYTLRLDCHQIGIVEKDVVREIYNLGIPCMIIGGIALFILQKLSLITVPQIINDLHLLISGMILKIYLEEFDLEY